MAHRLAARQVIRSVATAVVVGAALLAAAPAQAAFPGANGKIAFSCGNTCSGLTTVNPDGTGLSSLTSSPYDTEPAWSADGTKIAFRRGLVYDQSAQIWVMNANGSGQVQLTPNGASNFKPSWSPDGTRIAFTSNRDGNFEIYTMNSDGTGVTRLTNNQADDADPAWSPNGQKIAFSSARDGGSEVYSMNADGSQQMRLTTSTGCGRGPADAEQPDWSPDGQQIVSVRGIEDGNCEILYAELWLMDADGSRQRALTGPSDFDPVWSPDGKKIVFSSDRNGGQNGSLWVLSFGSQPSLLHSGADSAPDWQPLSTTSNEHPQSAPSLQASLVPTFRPCSTGANPTNGQHSPPLGTPACLPPVPGSNVARVGSSSVGSTSFTVVPGDSDPTNGDQANVTLSASLSDIKTAAGADYVPNPSGPDLTEITRLRFTDKANNYGGASGTATEYDFRVPLNCAATSDPSIGSTCSTSTSADSLLPGFITEQRQTVVQAFRVRVDDAGANGTTGDSDDRIFATQGIYIP